MSGMGNNKCVNRPLKIFRELSALMHYKPGSNIFYGYVVNYKDLGHGKLLLTMEPFIG